MDDGSSDGTSDMVRSEFPSARVERTPISLGLVAQRNRASLLSSGEIIFSIDDDAEFSTPFVVEQTLAGFAHSRVAAMAIPYVEPKKPKQEFRCAPDADAIWVTDSFRGTAYGLRRDVFLELGGYREQIIHQGEEMDFCIRLLNKGFVVRLGHGDVIIHYESPKRDLRRQGFYGRSNDILFAWRNVPMPYFPGHLLATSLNGLMHTVRTKSASDFQGMLSGYLGIVGGCYRQPVSRSTYRLHRLLKRSPRSLSEIEAFLFPLATTAAICSRPERVGNDLPEKGSEHKTWRRYR